MEDKKTIVQVRQPKTGQYLKVDRAHGLILDRSDEPYLDIPLLELPQKRRRNG